MCTKQHVHEWKPFQFEMLTLTHILQRSFSILHLHSAKHLYSVNIPTWFSKPGESICIMTGLELLDTVPLLTDGVMKPNGWIRYSVATFTPAVRRLDSRRCEILCQSYESEQRCGYRLHLELQHRAKGLGIIGI